MNLTPWTMIPHARTSDRLPHSGWAAFGPYVDHRARRADWIVFIVCVAGFVAAVMMP